MYFIIFRFSSCCHSSPHNRYKKQDSENKHAAKRGLQKRDIFPVRHTRLIELIIYRITGIYRNSHHTVHFPVSLIGPYLIPFSGFRDIHVCFKILQLRMDDHIPHRFSGFHLPDIIFQFIIITVLLFICDNFSGCFICINISKICIAFFQVLPPVFIYQQLIIQAAQRGRNIFIYNRQFSVKLRRLIHHLKQIVRTGRSIFFAQRFSEIPAVRVKDIPLRICDAHPVKTGSCKRTVLQFLKILILCYLIFFIIIKLYPELSPVKQCQEVFKIVVIIISIRLFTDNYTVIVIELPLARIKVFTPVFQLIQRIGHTGMIGPGYYQISGIIHNVHKLIRIVSPVCLKHLLQTNPVHNLIHTVFHRHIKVFGIFIRLSQNPSDICRIYRSRKRN